MASKPKCLVTRGDHDPEAIKRLAEFCDVEVCPEPRAMTRTELLKGNEILLWVFKVCHLGFVSYVSNVFTSRAGKKTIPSQLLTFSSNTSLFCTLTK